MRPFLILSALTIFIASETSADDHAILPAVRKTEAAHRQTTAQLAVEHHQQQVLALRELHAAGLASFLEITQAEKHLQRLQGECEAADEFASLLKSIDIELQNADAAKTSTLLLTVPGLLKTPALRQMAILQVPETAELREITQRPVNQSESPQLKARTELIDRLRQSQFADTAANAELSVAMRKRELAVHRLGTPSLLTDCLKFEGLSLDGNSIANSLELNVLLERRFGELQLRTAHRAVEAEVHFLSTLRTRLDGVPADARMPAEFIELQWQHDAATQQLAQIDAQRQQLAVLSNNRTNWRPASAESTPPAALFDLLDHRLDAARFEVQQQQQRLHSLQVRVEKVERLAAGDRFFVGEATRLRLDFALQQAHTNAANERFELTRLENELAVTILAGEDTSAAAAQVFEAMAGSPHQLAVKEAQEELTSWKRTATQQLFDDGHASWMECTAAKVRHEEAVIAVAEILQQQADCHIIAAALRNMSAVDVAANSN